ncbi:hypothetical protein B9Z19DRAFT_1120652 [Tuber borchii]|uniref:Uncharacterized protein n=1 Tax=Tuber borchii TaxID=42251 RepID=A0A2T7A427_TUBBO|nr:hypothetical protein B9Z19DRAFT_1120652 [Tuber borchii]
MSYLAGPAVLHNDGSPEVSMMSVDRILPSRPVRSSWQSPRRALQGPRPFVNTDSTRVFLYLFPHFHLRLEAPELTGLEPTRLVNNTKHTSNFFISNILSKLVLYLEELALHDLTIPISGA